MNHSLDNSSIMELVSLVHTQEARAIASHRYRSSRAKIMDLHYSSKSYDQAKALLEAATPADTGENDELSQIRNSLWSFARSSIRFSYEALKNLQLRSEYLEAANKLLTTLDRAAIDSWSNPSHKNFSTAMDTYTKDMNKLYDEWGQRTSSAWKRGKNTEWTKYILKNKNYRVDPKKYVDLSELATKMYAEQALYDSAGKPELNLTDQYIPLRETVKGQTGEQFFVILRRLGGVFMLFTTAVMLWFIIQSDEMPLTGAKASLSIFSSLLAGYAGTEATASLLAAFSGPGIVVIGGILAGVICAFAGGIAADCLFDAIVQYFTSGTSIPNQLKTNLFGPPIQYELTLPNSSRLSWDFVAKLQ